MNSLFVNVDELPTPKACRITSIDGVDVHFDVDQLPFGLAPWMLLRIGPNGGATHTRRIFEWRWTLALHYYAPTTRTKEEGQ